MTNPETYRSAQYAQDAHDLGFYATTADMTIYCDGTLGSDTTGNGTALLPYATIPHAYAQVSKILRHKVRIVMVQGPFTAFPASICPTIEQGGCLSFVGVGEPTVVLAGPLDIAARAKINSSSGFCSGFSVAVNTDTDLKLCVFDNTSNVRIRNRIGTTQTLKLTVWYN